MKTQVIPFDVLSTVAHYYAAKGRITMDQAVTMLYEGIEFANDKHKEAMTELAQAWLEQYSLDGFEEDEIISDARALTELVNNCRAAVWEAWDLRCEDRFGQSVCPWAFDVTIPVPAA